MFTKDDTNRIKGIAILLLIFHHMYRTTDAIGFLAAKAWLLSDADISQIAFCFRVCVYVFVFLSAYGISAGFKGKGVKSIFKYYAYRLWRFLSPYWFTLILLNLLYLIVYKHIKYSNPLHFLGDVIPVHDMLGRSELMFDGVFWYMNFTLLVILVLPLLHKLTEKAGVFVFLVTLATYGIVPVVLDSPRGGPYYSYIFVVELGILFQQKDILAAVKKRCGDFSKLTKTVCLTGLLLFSFLFPYMAWFVIPDNRFGIQPLFHTAGALSLVLCIYLCRMPRFMSWFLELLGKYSYDIFLTHVLIFRYSRDMLHIVRYVLPQYIVTVGLCLLIAFLIDLLKKATRWEKLIAKVSEKIKAAGN